MAFFDLYIGEIYALMGALFTAIGNAVFKRASDQMDIISMTIIRSFLGSFYYIMIILILRELHTIFSVSSYIFLMLMISMTLNIVIGDTAYLKAQHYIGMSRAAPLNRLKPLFTLLGAFILLGEPLTTLILLGVLLVIGGVYLITQPTNNGEPINLDNRIRKIGIGLAILSAVTQATGVLALRIAVTDLDAISANAIRFTVAFLILGTIGGTNGSVHKIRKYKRNTIKLVAIGTALNIGLGSLLWVNAVKIIGASKATTLGAVSPLFSLIIAILFLREPVTWKTIAGTLMVIIGVFFVI